MGGSISLATAPAAEPAVVGQKAAGLARATAAGLPVLPGWVLPLQESAPAIAAGVAALGHGGGPAALLAATRIALPARVAGELERVADTMGTSAVVRSSTAADGDGRWAGAFASYLDVGRELLPVAVRGCWASVFSRDVLARCEQVGSPVGDVRVAALIQPWVRFDAGGIAVRDHAGSVSVTRVAGGPAGLVGGRRSGRTVRVDRDDRVTESRPGGELSPTMPRAVARLARATFDATGHDCIEWGWMNGHAVLLQARTSERPADPPRHRGPWPAAPARAETLARIMARYGGRLGEELVVPWALGSHWVPSPEAVEVAGGEAALAEARSLAAALASDVWNMPPEAAARAAADATRLLLGPDPAAGMAAIEGLGSPDERMAARLLALVEGVSGRSGATGPRDRWAPFVFRVVRARGRELRGRSAAPGAGAGGYRWVGSLASLHDPSAASVVGARAPLPQLSPMLWHASGIVTAGGDPGAHVFEVARSLGVPAVVGVDLEPWRHDDALVGVDGDEGIVSVLPEDGGR
jgi:phosphohistidine swiveling domain-containing protein